MELMAERWTEDRLDDLQQEIEKQGRRMDDGFREVRGEIAGVRGEMNAVRGEMNDVRGEISGGRGEVAGVRGEISGVRGEVAGVRSEIGVLRKEMDQRFERAGERLEARFDLMFYALLGFGGAMFAAMASLVAAVIISL